MSIHIGHFVLHFLPTSSSPFTRSVVLKFSRAKETSGELPRNADCLVLFQETQWVWMSSRNLHL